MNKKYRLLIIILLLYIINYAEQKETNKESNIYTDSVSNPIKKSKTIDFQMIFDDKGYPIVTIIPYKGSVTTKKTKQKKNKPMSNRAIFTIILALFFGAMSIPIFIKSFFKRKSTDSK